MARRNRLNKLSRPRLQLSLVWPFVVGALVATIAHGTLFGLAMKDLAVSLPNDEAILLEQWPRMAVLQSVLMAGITSFLLALIGVLTTHRVGGAVFSMERYLDRVRRGVPTEPCSLRAGDELQELCGLINEVTAEQRVAPAPSEPSEGGPRREAAA